MQVMHNSGYDTSQPPLRWGLVTDQLEALDSQSCQAQFHVRFIASMLLWRFLKTQLDNRNRGTIITLIFDIKSSLCDQTKFVKQRRFSSEAF